MTITAPLPTETPYTLEQLGGPALAFAIAGEPAPQGSKTVGRRKNGTSFVRESSKKVKPWRDVVVAAIRDRFAATPGLRWEPLNDNRAGVVLDLVFTVSRPADRPKRLRCRPAVKPDLDKLTRAVLDALTTARVLGDDGRVVGFRRLDEFYVGDPDPDAMPMPGVVIRVWPLPLEAL